MKLLSLMGPDRTRNFGVILLNRSRSRFSPLWSLSRFSSPSVPEPRSMSWKNRPALQTLVLVQMKNYGRESVDIELCLCHSRIWLSSLSLLVLPYMITYMSSVALLWPSTHPAGTRSIVLFTARSSAAHLKISLICFSIADPNFSSPLYPNPIKLTWFRSAKVISVCLCLVPYWYFYMPYRYC